GDDDQKTEESDRGKEERERQELFRARPHLLSLFSLVRSLHLAWAARRSVRTPALDASIGHDFLNDRALLVEHCRHGLVLQDDAHERFGDGLVELPALRAEA